MENLKKMPLKTLEHLAKVLAQGSGGRKEVIREILLRKKTK
jgi:hypothetical protein